MHKLLKDYGDVRLIVSEVTDIVGVTMDRV